MIYNLLCIIYYILYIMYYIIYIHISYIIYYIYHLLYIYIDITYKLFVAFKRYISDNVYIVVCYI